MGKLYHNWLFMTIRNHGHNHPQIAENVYVDPQACVIGHVHIGKDSSVWPMAVIRGDVHAINIGERTSVQDNSTLHVTHESAFNPAGYGLQIGNDVTIGHNVVLHGCTIEDQCLIGIGSIILDGAILRKHVLLGAGSLVPPGKDLEGGFLWLGNPVKRVRALTEAEVQYFKYSAEHYLRVKNSYL
jgi:carbonic anhydrase/acetyltransferase-like protein (isoleucine patch superfamily)